MMSAYFVFAFVFTGKIAHLLTEQIATTNKGWNATVRLRPLGFVLLSDQPERRSDRSVGSSLSLLPGGWYQFSVTQTLPGSSLFLSTLQAGPPALHPPPTVTANCLFFSCQSVRLVPIPHCTGAALTRSQPQYDLLHLCKSDEKILIYPKL